MPSSEQGWTPDMPLRADATDEQIAARAQHWYVLCMRSDLRATSVETMERTFPLVAREFAFACVASARPQLVTRVVDGRAELQECNDALNALVQRIESERTPEHP